MLGYCTARELGALEATCSFFIKSGLTDRIAKHFLKDIPRAKGLRPDIRQARAQQLVGCRRSREHVAVVMDISSCSSVQIRA